jgi:hypothetical protein
VTHTHLNAQLTQRGLMMLMAFFVCHAPDAIDHFLALSGEFPLLVGFDVHFQEMPALLARRTTCTNDAAYYRQYPNLSQFVLTVSYLNAQVVPLLP